jgi:hypothetical protein
MPETGSALSVVMAADDDYQRARGRWIEAICTAYRAGENTYTIGDALGITGEAVRKILRSAGVERRRPGYQGDPDVMASNRAAT